MNMKDCRVFTLSMLLSEQLNRFMFEHVCFGLHNFCRHSCVIINYEGVEFFPIDDDIILLQQVCITTVCDWNCLYVFS